MLRRHLLYPFNYGANGGWSDRLFNLGLLGLVTVTNRLDSLTENTGTSILPSLLTIILHTVTLDKSKRTIGQAIDKTLTGVVLLIESLVPSCAEEFKPHIHKVPSVLIAAV